MPKSLWEIIISPDVPVIGGVAIGKLRNKTTKKMPVARAERDGESLSQGDQAAARETPARTQSPPRRTPMPTKATARQQEKGFNGTRRVKAIAAV